MRSQPFRASRLAVACVLVLAALAGLVPGTRPAAAADPQPYSVTVAPTGNSGLDTALHDSSSLISLREKAPVGPFALVTRARNDVGRLVTALHSFGYYKGEVSLTVAGRPLDAPNLVDTLSAMPAGQPVPVVLTPQTGPLFHLRALRFEGDLPPDIRAKVKLGQGDPAVAEDILGVKGKVLLALQESGHALATVSDPIALSYPDSNVIGVTYKVDAGPRVDIGPVRLAGLEKVNTAYVRRVLSLHDGQLYQPTKIEAARQDLASLGVFSSVQARASERLNAEGRLPVTFVFTEAPRHAVSLGASYSTDLGAAVTASWMHRNLFGNGERLTLSAAATELGGSAVRQPGYNVGANLTIPDWLRRDQTLAFDVAALKQYLETYQQTAYTAGVTVTRKLSPHVTVSLGLGLEQEKIIQEGVSRTYTLLSLPVGLKYDNTDDLFAPTRGYRAQALVTPTEALGGHGGNSSFVLMQASGSTYLDLTGSGRSILALRALIGTAQGASVFDLPPDRRFYAGGSATVRGYKYQWVGPHFPDGIPIGGTSVDAATVEFRQRIGKKFGAVVFADAGQVSAGGGPFGGQLDVGVGVGARYYTSFGPIRLDVAVPLTKEPRNGSFQFYIGIGEAF